MESKQADLTLSAPSASHSNGNNVAVWCPDNVSDARDAGKPMPRVRQQKRLQFIIAEVKKNGYPSTSKLAKLLSGDDTDKPACERTLRRDIHLLKNSYHAPIEYCPENKGWALTNPYWGMPNVALMDDEMLALLLAQKLVRGWLPEPVQEKLDGAVDDLIAGGTTDMEEMARVCDAVVVVGGPVPPPVRSAAAVATAYHAFFNCRVIEIRYAETTGEIRFPEVELHALFRVAGPLAWTWHFRARVGMAGAGGQDGNWVWLEVDRIAAARERPDRPGRFVRARSAARATSPEAEFLALARVA